MSDIFQVFILMLVVLALCIGAAHLVVFIASLVFWASILVMIASGIFITAFVVIIIELIMGREKE